jgi:hypothetical protein
LRGDVDRDGGINVTDAVNILNHLFLGSFTPYCLPVADVDGDGEVDITDPVRALFFLFLDAPAPPDLSAEEQAACTNNPPTIAPRPIYRTYPGYPVELPIEAEDPEGDALLYEGIDLPAGATCEHETGVLSWMPSPEQLGPFYLSFAVSDAAAPPNRVTGQVTIHVLPLDACTVPVCQPALGCESVLVPITEDCCGDPGARVADPEAGCPDGRVLHVGRNLAGAPTIGRLVNCDRLRLIPLGQGGHETRLNLEARCLNPEQVTIRARLLNAATTFFDETAVRRFEQAANGYVQVRGLRFGAEGFFAEGQEAQLSVTVIDSDLVVLEKHLRVIMTRDPVPDLP